MATRTKRAARQERRVEAVAYQLYQRRMQSHSSGDEANDWPQAKKIAQSPLRRSLYFMN